MNNDYDVVVVGAGPAGSTAARCLSRDDLNVLLVDRIGKIGDKVQCAEYAPKPIDRLTPVRSVDIAQQVRGIKTIINGEYANTIEAPGYVLNRKSWDKNLWELAANAGACTALGTVVTDIKADGVRLQTGGASTFVRCRMIVGCDGPNSLVSKYLGNGRQKNSIALQFQMNLARPMEYVEIYFYPGLFGGYAWVFPKGTTANVGLGVHIDYANRTQDLLNGFCESLVSQGVLKDMYVLDKTAGLVPCGGLADKLGSGNILIAGDAAGCTNPITGAGIMSAVVSGKQAAESIVGYFRKPYMSVLPDSYHKAINTLLGQGLKRALQKKDWRDAVWTNDPVKFAQIIRNSWVSFPEYYNNSNF